MKTLLKKADGSVTDVTEVTGELTFSGSSKESARVFETEMLRPNINPLLPGAPVTLGDTVEVLDGNHNIFMGVLWDIEADDNNIGASVTCYDMAVYLNKNEPKEQVFTNQTPQDITAAICKEFGLKVGELAKGDPVTVNGRGQKAYDVIMQAYTKQHDKDGKQYKLLAKGDVISVVESGTKHPIVLEELSEPLPGKVLGLSYRQSMDELVNAITAVDEEKEDESKENEDATSQEQYGKIQKLMRGDADQLSGAMEKAKTVAEVEVVADWDMVTGVSVQLKHALLSGEFYIIADAHHYKDGLHTAELTLSTEYEMDTRTEEQRDSSGEGADGAGMFGAEGDGLATGRWLDPTRGAGYVSQGWPGHEHGNAIDIAAPTGTPLYASDGGTVARAEWDYSYGNVVYINHGNGYQTRYAHIMKDGFAVRYGQKVTRGQLIAYMGSTGNSTGPHIHFEILRNGYGTYPGPLIGR